MSQKFMLGLMSSVLLSVVLLERFHRLYTRVLFCAKKRAAVGTFQPVNTLQADEAPHDAAFFSFVENMCHFLLSRSLRLFSEFIFLLFFQLVASSNDV